MSKAPSMSKTVSKCIRVLTVAPLVIFIVATILYFNGGVFVGLSHYLMTLFTLVLLPVLAYPVSALVPALRQKGREGQRTLAMLFSVAGYLIGFAFTLAANGSSHEKILFGSYLITGLVLLLAKLLFGKKPSGHAAGLAGPITMLAVWCSPWYALGYLLLFPLFAASVSAKRHTLPQLFFGALIPIAALLILSLLFR